MTASVADALLLCHGEEASPDEIPFAGSEEVASASKVLESNAREAYPLPTLEYIAGALGVKHKVGGGAHAHVQGQNLMCR